jgi:excinuclease ABC subunit A
MQFLNVREHNLKGIDLNLNAHELIVFTGVSGSGKSSLAFDTIYVEGQRRYLESLSTHIKRRMGSLEKPAADLIEGISPTIAIEQKTAGKNPRSTVGTMTECYDFLRVLYSKIGINYCPKSLEKVTSQTTNEIVQEIFKKFKGEKICILAPFVSQKKGNLLEDINQLQRKGFLRAMIDKRMCDLSSNIELDKSLHHDLDVVIDRIVCEDRNRLLESIESAVHIAKGTVKIYRVDTEEVAFFSTLAYSPKSKISYPILQPHDFSFNHPSGMCEACQGLGCTTCKNSRLKPYPSATKLFGKTIQEITDLSIEECLHFFSNLELCEKEEEIGKGLILEIKRRLQFLCYVGLHYLCLSRGSQTLSGGESQRVRLASQIGSSLVGATYILDEPSIGLHPRDNHKLIDSLLHLKNQGNTIIVVEHDEEMILAADTIVDIGPGAGKLGGNLLVHGSLLDLLNCKESITGQYLRKEKSIQLPQKRRTPSGFLKLIGAEHHNLKKIDIAFPLGTLFAVTGVSGSGKSSLISETLYPALKNKLHKGKEEVGKYERLENIELIDKVIAIDQSPIGRTPRSNPATYTKVFDDIRELFARLPEAKAYGFDAGRFSFNVKEGSCPHCLGMGQIRVDMDFMEDQLLMCPSCEGKQFDPKTLSILYKGKSIFDVLSLTVDEALIFFADIPPIANQLTLLVEVGLGHMAIGQPSTTLSGGEAQRIKLARELSRKETGKTLYILDEPTTGLHFHDINNLLVILQRLVSHGNTVCVIEHNLDLIQACDWVIDIGPEGGNKGGRVLYNGPLLELLKEDIATGQFLKAFMERKPEEFFKIAKRKIDHPKITAITVKNARQNNLKSVCTSIPLNAITVCTGPSGSGKSSFAFDTIYAEGQRRYVESLSSFAKQLINMCPKADVDSIEGLCVSIALEQSKNTSNPRSTVGTITEIYDYLRILFAKEGIPYCPKTGERIHSITKEFVAKQVIKKGGKIQILAPLTGIKSFDATLAEIRKMGFLRIRLNKVIYEIDDDIPYKKGMKNELDIVIDRLIIKEGIYPRLLEAIETAARFGKNKVIALFEEDETLFNLAFAVEKTGQSYETISPHTFSFNAEEGMCLFCQGIGSVYRANLDSDLFELTPLSFFHLLLKENGSRALYKIFSQAMKHAGISLSAPLQDLSKEKLDIFLLGSSKPFSIDGVNYAWVGVEKALEIATKSSRAKIKQSLLPLMKESLCTHCNGSRLNPLASAVKLEGKTIQEVTHMESSSLFTFIKNLKCESIQEVIDQILSRLHFLLQIGLGYISLDRSAPTLSGGEMQRIKLTRQLGSSLSGCLYVIDEPSIGLHPRNNHLLNETLKHLQSLGNTLLLVEHDPMTLEIADHIIDFGKGAGRFGGEIMATGSVEEIKANKDSLTGEYLSDRKQVPKIAYDKKPKKFLKVKNANVHNLKNISVDIPLGTLTCLTGVSGSGKSTLMHEVIKPLMQRAIKNRLKENSITGEEGSLEGLKDVTNLLVVDQSPIGQTSRSDVSTYAELLTPLRGFFASLPEAKMRGLLPVHFSFNHLRGMCRKCWGLGYKSIDLKYLPPVRIECPDCHGNRLAPLSLSVEYQGKNLGEILKMSITSALEFLPPIPKLQHGLETLISIGLGYLNLGQEVQTLSGGEAQRLRLAKALAKSIHSKTLILLDEPTTGLHFEDVATLLKVFEKILEKKATLLVAEHNLDLIASAEYIIDLGKDAGVHGGEVLYQGPLNKIDEALFSYTRNYLKKII